MCINSLHISRPLPLPLRTKDTTTSTKYCWDRQMRTTKKTNVNLRRRFQTSLLLVDGAYLGPHKKHLLELIVLSLRRTRDCQCCQKNCKHFQYTLIQAPRNTSRAMYDVDVCGYKPNDSSIDMSNNDIGKRFMWFRFNDECAIKS
jgi:hypothetical protein